MDDHVELGQEFWPSSLASGEEFSSCEILQIFVVSDNINQGSATFQILAPVFECFEDCK